MIKKKSFSAAVLTAATLSAGSAFAATCADRDAVVERLETRFGETLIANSMSSSNNVLEVFAANEAASWTILLTLPVENLTCLVGSGGGQTELAAVLEEM